MGSDVRPDVAYASEARSRLPEIDPGLDPDDFALAYALVHLSTLFSADLEEQVHRPRGLSLPGFRLMFKLLALGPTRPTLLAELSGISGASVTSLVRTLENKGLVRRRRAQADRRGVEVALTPAGRSVTKDALAAHAVRESEWFAPLSPSERQRLADLLGRLIRDRPGS
jgi:DNA-binding MarR family transcriptional regulator